MTAIISYECMTATERPTSGRCGRGRRRAARDVGGAGGLPGVDVWASGPVRFGAAEDLTGHGGDLAGAEEQEPE